MKLSNVYAKLTCIKLNVVRTFVALTVAAAALTVAAPYAAAQRVAFGVQFGGPRYVAPVPVVRGYGSGYGYGNAYGYGGPRADAWREREILRERAEWRRREEWRRFHREPYSYAPPAYGYRGY